MYKEFVDLQYRRIEFVESNIKLSAEFKKPYEEIPRYNIRV